MYLPMKKEELCHVTSSLYERRIHERTKKENGVVSKGKTETTKEK